MSLWFAESDAEEFDWPQNSDLNPTELYWDELEWQL